MTATIISNHTITLMDRVLRGRTRTGYQCADPADEGTYAALDVAYHYERQAREGVSRPWQLRNSSSVWHRSEAWRAFPKDRVGVTSGALEMLNKVSRTATNACRSERCKADLQEWKKAHRSYWTSHRHWLVLFARANDEKIIGASELPA